MCQQVAYEVNSLPADFLAIATYGLANAKYQGSQILTCVDPACTKGNQSRISLPNWLTTLQKVISCPYVKIRKVGPIIIFKEMAEIISVLFRKFPQ
jgi:hypothetical protein